MTKVSVATILAPCLFLALPLGAAGCGSPVKVAGGSSITSWGSGTGSSPA